MNITGNALVIGAGGIGKACALAFAKRGARGVVVCDVDVELARRIAEDCRAAAAVATTVVEGGVFTAEGLPIDVADEGSVSEAIALASRTLGGRIDYCVNAAGIGVQQAREVAESDVDEFSNMLKVHVGGAFLVLRAISALMKAQDAVPVDPASPARGVTRGVVAVVGSASAFVATPGMIQYTGSKHAVVGLVKSAALDNAAYGIRVNAVCPSWVDTAMTRRALEGVPGLAATVEAAVPLGRVALAEEVADAVIFLCSPSSSYATGINLILDGGTTLTSHT